MWMTSNDFSDAFQFGAPSTRLAGGYEPGSPAGRSGEHRLMLAILEDAVALYVKSLCEGHVARHEGREARQWLMSRDRSSPFTFECICDLLGLDSGYVRRGLRAVGVRSAEARARLAARRHRGRSSGPAVRVA